MATIKPDCNLCKHHVQGVSESEQPVVCWDCKGYPVSLPNFELDEEVALAMQAGGVPVTCAELKEAGHCMNATEVRERRIELSNPVTDNVNHPSHYTSHPSGVECITITEHMNFCVGNAIKYMWRAGLKDSAALGEDEKHLQDLKKARWYIDREIERREKDGN